LTLNNQSLIDFDRDRLHRETQRYLHGLEKQQELRITRSRDSLGRLSEINFEGLQGLGTPPTLIGQVTSHQYHYDPLDRLIAIQMPQQTLRYGYDGAGRLRSQSTYDTSAWLRAVNEAIAPEISQRWTIDPAGNRLPIPQLAGENRQQQDWAATVYQGWKDPSFNLLQADSASNPDGTVEQWPDNRIGYYEDQAWRYNTQGSRVEQMSLKQNQQGQYPRQRLSYDGANQLTQVEIARVIGRGYAVAASQCRYIYDALGRRLKKTYTDDQGQEHITYFGWDSDRQVRTETVRDDGTRHIVHTVYEPGVFAPMVRLSKTIQGDPQAKPSLLMQAAQAAWSITPNDPGVTAVLGSASKAMEQNIQYLLEDRLTPLSRSIIGRMGVDPDALIARVRQGLEQAQQAQRATDIVVHYFHCNLLGTPLALTDQQGQIVWAAQLDPWGNIEEEYNPQDIEQNIRLPGQYHDRETGLYYNRFRYYDPKIGVYINQDPIGLAGGIHLYHYPFNPVTGMDPFGLDEKTINMRACPALSPVQLFYFQISFRLFFKP
jgi:RHS repeat-associated protein